MLAANVLNSRKKQNVSGIFHLFYDDETTSHLFDSDLLEPIIWGSKNVVLTHLKKADELMGVPDTTKITIYQYKLTSDGFKRFHTYSGPINTIGKYVHNP